MTDTPKDPASDSPAAAPSAPAEPVKPTRSPEQAAKAKRLASALRDNLKRRKAAHRPLARPGH